MNYQRQIQLITRCFPLLLLISICSARLNVPRPLFLILEMLIVSFWMYVLFFCNSYIPQNYLVDHMFCPCYSHHSAILSVSNDIFVLINTLLNFGRTQFAILIRIYGPQFPSLKLINGHTTMCTFFFSKCFFLLKFPCCPDFRVMTERCGADLAFLFATRQSIRFWPAASCLETCNAPEYCVCQMSLNILPLSSLRVFLTI